MPDPAVMTTCPCTEMRGQVLAKDGQGGRDFPWSYQLESPPWLAQSGSPEPWLCLGLQPLQSLSCFSSWSRAKGTSLLCPWGLPNPGLQEHPSHQELQVQLSPQVSSPALLRGAQPPSQPFLCSSAPASPTSN